MNFRYVLGQLGLLLVVLSGCMLLVTAWAAWLLMRGDTEEFLAILSLVIAAVLGGAVGGVMWLAGRRGHIEQLGRREALLLVALSWFVGAALSATPFFFWAHLHEGHFPGETVVPAASQPATLDAEGPVRLTPAPLVVRHDHPFLAFASCYFEAMSGLTTTGATVLADIDAVPAGLLLWRATTHWLGGLGIVVLFVAVLPTLGIGGKRLFQLETPGPKKSGVRPRITETARVLWMIYLVMTLAAVLCLRLAGMSWFDSVCHSFSMVSTGGLSTRDASIGHFDSVAIDLVCIVFMLLAGVSFTLFFELTRGRYRNVWRDVELRVYLGLKVIVLLVVAANLMGTRIVTTAGDTLDATVGQALRYATFQTVALHTGTGFVTADYDPWPFLSRTLLVGLMFVGGCAGSTAGGIKVIRFWIALKVIIGSLEHAFRPQVVRPLRVGGGVVDNDMKLGAMTYFLTMIGLFGVGAAGIGLLEGRGGNLDFLSASISTLCNVGPGLRGVGATQNYGWFSHESLVLMSVLMALGRLEVYAILALLLPAYWKQD